MPKIIIDGYNVIHAVPELAARLAHDLSDGRTALLQRLSSYVCTRKVEVVAVFDGAQLAPTSPAEAAPPRVRVLFSRPPATADSVIEHLLCTEARPRNLTLVSGDRHLADIARARGAKVLSPQEFVRHIESKPSTQDLVENKFGHQLSEEELREWLSLFGEHKDLTPRP